MSSGKVQNPPGFALCRVTKSKTRRVSRHVVWQSPKPVGFRTMSCDNVQNLPGFWCTRVGAQKHTPPNILRQGFAPKIGRVLGVSLLGMDEIGRVLGISLLERVKSGRFLVYPYWEG